MKRIILLIGLLSSFISAAPLTYSGDISAVSTYVWRGIKQFNGVALQGSAGLDFGIISTGIWYSTVNFGTNSPVLETDPFLNIAITSGDIESNVGLTVYTYDLSSFNATADVEYEFYGSLGLNSFSLAGYYVPSQSSTKADVADTFYWLQAGYDFTVEGVDLNASYAYGNYSSRFTANPDSKAVGHVLLGASKALGDLFSVNWTYSVATSKSMENLFWIGLSTSF